MTLFATVLAVLASMLPGHHHPRKHHRHHQQHHRHLRPLRMFSALASWFDDAGGTACGFHATYGFANKTLPCGTRVTFEHAGRRIVGVVEDRGPFIAGRDFDLNAMLKGALGCSDLCVVEVSTL